MPLGCVPTYLLTRPVVVMATLVAGAVLFDAALVAATCADRIPFGDNLGLSGAFAVASGGGATSWSLAVGGATRIRGLARRSISVGLVTAIAFASIAPVLMLDLEPLCQWRHTFGVMRAVILLSTLAGSLGACAALRQLGRAPTVT